AGDDFIDQFVDVLGGNFFERTAGGFDGIGEEDDGAFAKLRFGAVVAVGAFADFFDFDAAGSGGGGFAFANLFLFGLVVKVLGEGRSVVLTNGGHDDARKLVFYGVIYAVFDVAFDDEGGKRGAAILVRVDAFALVFGEIFRFDEFSDVVKC